MRTCLLTFWLTSIPPVHIPHRSDGDRFTNALPAARKLVHIPHRSDGDYLET